MKGHCAVMNIFVLVCVVLLGYRNDKMSAHAVNLPEWPALAMERLKLLKNYVGRKTDVNSLHVLFRSRFSGISQTTASLDNKLADYISTEISKDVYKEIDFHDVHHTFHDVITNPLNSSARTPIKNVTMVMKETYAFLYGFLLRMNDISIQCSIDMSVVILNVLNRKRWAMELVDSLGHVESGLLDGNIHMLGSIGECTHINPVLEERRLFQGKYCTFNLHRTFGGSIGTCVPSACKKDDVERLYEKIILENKVTDAHVSCVEDNPLPTEAIVCICVLAVLVMFIAICTVYDLVTNQRLGNVPRTQCNDTEHGHPKTTNQISICNPMYEGQEKKEDESESNTASENVNNESEAAKETEDGKLECKGCNKGKLDVILRSFSAYSNMKMIFVVTENQSPLSAIHGIRFLSISWIILTHTYFYDVAQTDNAIQYFVREKMKSVPFLVIPGGVFAVDSFFTLSGLLVSYLTLTELQKMGGAKRFNWVVYYLHRFIRVTPSYALVIMVTVCLYGNLLDRSIWPNLLHTEGCKKYWWRNLLYIDTFFDEATMNKCIGWTWFLANDMQMFWISPLMIIPLYYNTILGTLTCGVLLASTTIALGVFSFGQKYSAQPFVRHETNDFEARFNNVYTASYMRIGPYIIGVFTGFLLYKTERKMNIPKVVNILCWIVCVCISTALVYSVYTDNISNVFTLQESAVYRALSKSAFGIVVSWIVFACATNHGGWINRMLSWKLFTPLARLSYCAYLVHPVVITTSSICRRDDIHFTTYEVVYLFIGNLVLSFVMALVTSILIEVPTRRIEKILMTRYKKH